MGEMMLKQASALAIGILVSAGIAGAAPSTPTTQVRLVNGSTSAIVALQVKPSGRAAWTLLFERKFVGIQREVPYDLVPGECVYDIQALFADGHSVNKQRQPLCQLPKGKYLITDY